MITQSTTEFTGFCLEDDEPELNLTDMMPKWAQPILTAPPYWENYSDELVYQADKRIREWIETMKPTWKKQSRFKRRYPFKDLAQILGIDKEVYQKKNFNKISKVFAYYSTKYAKEAKINGIHKKNVYTISPARLKLQPYSLKLRLEQMEGEGTWRNFQLPKDDLEKGHARFPRTEANMQKRSEEAKRKYNEYQQKRRAELNSSTEDC